MSCTICNILGVNVSNININEATTLLLLYIESDEKKMIFTPNPEFIMNSMNDSEFKNILNKSNLNIADGIGIVIAGKILGYKFKERVAGYDLLQNLFTKIRLTDKTVYMIGSSDEVVTRAKEQMEKMHRGLKILGVHNGYFSENEETILIDEINALSPDIILVGLGSPKQEKWIYKNIDKLNTKVMIGVGGSLDVMSGDVKRAPKIFIKLNLEWFYRAITQPKRIKRTLKLPLFIVEIIKYKIKSFIKKDSMTENKRVKNEKDIR